MGSVKNAFFLRRRARLPILNLRAATARQFRWTQQADASRFTGELEVRSAGSFRAWALPGFALWRGRTFLGDLDESVVTPVAIPAASIGWRLRSPAPHRVHKSSWRSGRCCRWAGGESPVLTAGKWTGRTECLPVLRVRRGRELAIQDDARRRS